VRTEQKCWTGEQLLRDSELTAWDESVGTTHLWVLYIMNAEKKNGWFAARFVLDSRPPAAWRSREDERGNV
jgi:hypothetical protein